MGEVSTEDFARVVGGSGDEEDERVMAWEMGLPGADDLTPLSQSLIPPELASAFNIKPEPYRTALDVNRASQTTLSSLRGGQSSPPSFAQNGFKSFNEIINSNSNNNNNLLMVEDNDNDEDERSDSRKMRRIGGIDTAMEEADSALNSNDDNSARTLKRPRLVWTPQLHKRFVDVVSHLGIKNAVPKTIMQMMNVEGLTRENVASHLQKYRLYLKRMQGLSNEGPSSSDQLFATTPVPQNLKENGGGSGHGHGHGGLGSNGHVGIPVPMPYGAPLMPMQMLGMGHHHQMGGMLHGMGGFNGMEAHNQHPYGMMQQRDWSGNYNGSVVSYPHITSGEK